MTPVGDFLSPEGNSLPKKNVGKHFEFVKMSPEVERMSSMYTRIGPINRTIVWGWFYCSDS